MVIGRRGVSVGVRATLLRSRALTNQALTRARRFPPSERHVVRATVWR
jgi:hypothetical protein